MTTKAQLLERISKLPDNDDEYAVAIFGKEDVLDTAEEMSIELTDEQVKKIVRHIDESQDYSADQEALESYIEDCEQEGR